MLIPIKKKYQKESVKIAFDIYYILRERLLTKDKFDRDKEHFFCALLSRSNRIQFIDEVAIGCLHSVTITPREVFRMAIHKGCSSIIIAHSHPSGNLKPSLADKVMTRELTKAGEIIGIKVLDSLIITEKSYYSFAGNGDI